MVEGLCPRRVVGDVFFISTTSSATNLCPLTTRSSTISLFPTPLLPRRRTPTPKTSTKTPWKVIVGAKRVSKYFVILDIKSELNKLDLIIDTPVFLADSIITRGIEGTL